MIAPREKLDTQFILKIGNLAEKRWLSDVQFLCRMCEIFRASRSAAFHSKAVCGHFGNPALASR